MAPIDPKKQFATPASKPQRKRFVPSGSPLRQSQWLNRINKQLEREARDLRRAAGHMDRLRAKVDLVRADKKRLSDVLLCEVVNFGQGAGRHYVARLAGVERYSDGYDLVRQICDMTRASPITPRSQDTLMPNESASSDATHADALSEAVSIVRNLDVTEIDWSKEPSSDYERKIRIEYLVDAGVLRLVQLMLEVPKPASDLQKAINVLQSETDKLRATRERHRIQEIREKIDRGDE